MEDLWLSNNKIENYEDFNDIKNLPKLQTIYLGGNPVTNFMSYREEVMQLCPNITQIDCFHKKI